MKGTWIFYSWDHHPGSWCFKRRTQPSNRGSVIVIIIKPEATHLLVAVSCDKLYRPVSCKLLFWSYGRLCRQQNIASVPLWGHLTVLWCFVEMGKELPAWGLTAFYLQFPELATCFYIFFPIRNPPTSHLSRTWSFFWWKEKINSCTLRYTQWIRQKAFLLSGFL